LFVNDRVDVALAVGADGVHLGGGALTVDDTQALAPRMRIALSTHTMGEVSLAAADPRVSFVVFGPIFDTPSKRAFGPPQGLPSLRAACSAPIPVLALGGVGPDQIPACFGAGASGVASIGAWLRNPAPETVLRRFFEAIEST
jgi:thiamine-phosphate pyrophosphorylase